MVQARHTIRDVPPSMTRRALLTGALTLATAPAAAGETPPDWAGLRHYAADNAVVARRPQAQRRVVFIGDSITVNWADAQLGGDFMPAHGFVGRGIGGQTSAQMLVRFWADVIDLAPRAVHILAGTNDIAGNDGPYDAAATQRHLQAMAALAHARALRVILGTVPPATSIPWRPDLGDPSGRIGDLNNWIRLHCRRQSYFLADYASVLADASHGLDPAYGLDPVHPNRAGYARMSAVALRAVKEAIG